ncbi:MAG: type I-E CRISPR-associated protein Cas5/CasD [Rubricoccaceae bacterium]
MTGFLLHLYGPMQAWGDTGFGQLREAGEFPSRAAVLGLVAAALGLPRADDRLVLLHEALRVDVATARPGDVRRDFHTVETRVGGNRTLTARDYHHDAHFVALVRPAAPEHASLLADAEAALRRPAFGTFLGRRSCPPALPLLPDAVKGDAHVALVAAAEHTREAFPRDDRTWRRRDTRSPLTVWLDGHIEAAAIPEALRSARSVTHGTRRARLIGPRRAYAASSFTRVVLAHSPALSQPDPNETYFDAIPDPPAPAS